MNLDLRITPMRIAAAAALAGLVACGGGGGSTGSTNPPATVFQVTKYVSDQASVATRQDANLVNAWGLAYGPATGFWVANQGSKTSTVVDGFGVAPVPAVNITIPSAVGPSGVVYNGTADFSADRFIFAALDGTISGWSTGAAAVVRKDNSASGAIYTGLALASVSTTNYLYATNFAAGTIDVLDGSYATANLGATAFQDSTLPAGYYPFNIQKLGTKLYVTYAQRNASNRSVAGAGLGYVNAFNPDGSFVGRLISQGALNAPWGLAMAPAGFGSFGGTLLVGNFGDGRINAYDATTGAAMGQLTGAAAAPIAVDGLWGITFGNGASAGYANQLYFAAGPGAETHGLFGTISFGAPGTPGGGGGGGY